MWNARCNANRCSCRTGFVKLGSQLCARQASALGEACGVDEQCSRIANSECKPSGSCWCSDGHVPRQLPTANRRRRQSSSMNRCLPLRNLGERCEVTRQCSTRHAVCSSAGVCQCDGGRVTRGEQINECLARVEKLGEQCTVSAQCELIAGAVCSASSNQCDCNVTTHCRAGGDGSASTCLQKVGDNEGACAEECQCEAIGARCVKSKCQCADDKVFVDGRCVGECSLFNGGRGEKWCRNERCCFETKQSKPTLS